MLDCHHRQIRPFDCCGSTWAGPISTDSAQSAYESTHHDEYDACQLDLSVSNSHQAICLRAVAHESMHHCVYASYEDCNYACWEADSKGRSELAGPKCHAPQKSAGARTDHAVAALLFCPSNPSRETSVISCVEGYIYL